MPGIGEAVLAADVDRTAERIQAEHRVGAGNDRHRRDQLLRNQVPVDAVAKHFVDAHAIEIDRHALRTAEQRRRGKAAELQVRLQRIGRRRIDRHAGHVAVHVVGDAERLRAVEFAARRRLHVVRDHRFRQIRALLRRDGDDVDRAEFGFVRVLRWIAHRAAPVAQCPRRLRAMPESATPGRSPPPARRWRCALSPVDRSSADDPTRDFVVIAACLPHRWRMRDPSRRVGMPSRPGAGKFPGGRGNLCQSGIRLRNSASGDLVQTRVRAKRRAETTIAKVVFVPLPASGKRRGEPQSRALRRTLRGPDLEIAAEAPTPVRAFRRVRCPAGCRRRYRRCRRRRPRPTRAAARRPRSPASPQRASHCAWRTLLVSASCVRR